MANALYSSMLDKYGLPPEIGGPDMHGSRIVRGPGNYTKLTSLISHCP